MKRTAQKRSPFLSKFSGLRPLIFVIVFALLGTIYLVASHAASPTNVGYVTILVRDTHTMPRPLSGVVVTYDNGATTFGCLSPALTANTSTSDGNGQLQINCNIDNQANQSINGTFQIRSISLPGYSVATTSPIKPGSTITIWANGQTMNHSAGTIILGEIPPMLPAPPSVSNPTPTPTPAPAPAPSKSSSSSSTSTHKTTTPKTTATLPTSSIPEPSTTEATPSTVDVQPGTDGNGEITNTTSLDANVLKGQTSTLKSSDDLVSVTFPKGTFDADAFCAIDVGDAGNVPVQSGYIVGPYSLDCIDANGNSLSDLNQSVTVTINLPTGSKYTAYVNDGKWAKVSSTNDNRTVSFKLTKAQLFAVAPPKASKSNGLLLNIVGAFVIIAIIGGGLYLFRRRQNPYGY